VLRDPFSTPHHRIRHFGSTGLSNNFIDRRPA